MSKNILTIKNLEKVYVTDSERLQVLKGLNLTVEEGSKIAIVGESGSGKSTLLNIIAGIDSVTSGSVIAGTKENGEWEVTTLSEAKMSEYRSRFIGLIFQFHYLLKDFTALENVYMPALIAGMSKKEAMERATGLLADVGLADRAGHLPSQLSGGERQRVAAARALINDPSLILADEPTGNLDPANAQKIGELLFSMADKYKKTLILVTHDMKLAANGDKQLQIVEGKLK
jgi:lipoprotein-releasing system ATP-binding protein